MILVNYVPAFYLRAAYTWEGIMKKRTKIILVCLVLVVAIAGGLLARYLISVQNYRDAVANITYQNTNATGVPDGVYTGECDVGFIYAKVEVTVQNGAIANIVLLEHRHDKGQNAEGIEQQIVAQQTLLVDDVAGATNSSRVIKKAIDNALASAR